MKIIKYYVSITNTDVEFSLIRRSVVKETDLAYYYLDDEKRNRQVRIKKNNINLFKNKTYTPDHIFIQVWVPQIKNSMKPRQVKKQLLDFAAEYIGYQIYQRNREIEKLHELNSLILREIK